VTGVVAARLLQILLVQRTRAAPPSGSSPQKDILTYPEISRDILRYPNIRISQGYLLWISKDMVLDIKGYLPWISKDIHFKSIDIQPESMDISC
jgi:hypothetical protein